MFCILKAWRTWQAFELGFKRKVSLTLIHSNLHHAITIKKDTSSQFHQHFLRAFFVWKSFFCVEFGFEQTFVWIICAKTLMKLTAGEFWLNLIAQILNKFQRFFLNDWFILSVLSSTDTKNMSNSQSRFFSLFWTQTHCTVNVVKKICNNSLRFDLLFKVVDIAKKIV